MRGSRSHISSFAVFIILLVTIPFGSIRANTCIDCHSARSEKRLKQPALGLPGDVHAAKGLACQDCHGGNPDRGWPENDYALAHDSARGFVGAPVPTAIPDFCGRCHDDVEYMKKYNPKQRVDQLLEYRSSRHGKLLAEGDAKVATCISCHGVHGILPVADTRSPVYKTNLAATCARCHADATYMAPYGIPTNQVEQYRASVHGQKLAAGDLAAPTCNNCHGNHGATPPGITSVSFSCGECHANNREFFNQSKHKAAFADLEVGECDACHGHHDVAHPTDEMVGIGENSVCLTCHSDGDAGFTSAAAMATALDSLKRTLASAHELLDRSARGGVDVALAKYDLHSADDALIKARTAVHYFDTAQFNGVVRPGFDASAGVIAAGEQALWDLKMRRIGLGFTLPIVLLVALALYVKIRRMERQSPVSH